jgi:CheY-like chemotaxis protein
MGSLNDRATTSRSPSTERRFLIVDDDQLVRELFANVLSALGRVDVAADGIEALAWLSRAHYDLILSDVDMPRLDGCGFFETAVAEQPDLVKAFVFITARGDAEARLRFFRSKGLPVLYKPIRVDELEWFVQGKLITAASHA